MKNFSELRTAVHEAGHAIVCIDQGKPFDSIDLTKKTTHTGMQWGQISRSPDTFIEKGEDWKVELMKNVLILFGGLAADSHFLQRQPADIFQDKNVNGAGEDMSKAVKIGKELLRLSDDEMVSYIDSSMARTMEIVGRRWKDVNLLAVELVKRKKMTYDECVSSLTV